MYISAIKLILAALATLALVSAVGYITRNAQPIVILSAWIAIWWAHSLFDGNGLRPLVHRPVVMRVVSAGIILALGTACYRSGVSNDAIAFSLFAVATLGITFIWLLFIERPSITKIFKRHQIDW